MKKKDMSKIAQVKVDLRNKNKMYENSKTRVNILLNQLKTVKEENKKYLETIKTQKDDLERLQHTIDEYSRMIFHKKKKKTETIDFPNSEIQSDI